MAAAVMARVSQYGEAADTAGSYTHRTRDFFSQVWFLGRYGMGRVGRGWGEAD